MQAVLQIARIEDCNEWLESNADKYENIQSISVLIEDVGTLVKAMAFVNNQMAVAKKELNEAKTKAYTQVMGSLEAQGKNGAPSLVKDYINSKCSQEMYNYDVCERCSRTIVHTIDALRTCISALKVEMSYSNYSNT
jgi:ABC-type taurine transport system substrate-binding protein